MKQYKKYLEAKKLNECGYHKQALQIYQSLYNDEPDNDLINYGLYMKIFIFIQKLNNKLEVI